MIQIDKLKNCNGCHACFSICPQKCINMISDHEGFLYPNVDNNHCIKCKKCEKVCPLLNGKTYNHNSYHLGYAAYNLNDEIRLNSSSGGLFTILAEYILSKDGVVIGAAMEDDCKSVHHVLVDSSKDLFRLRGSKYLQSTINDIFLKTKELLENGKCVLFTGTPCQIGGLYSYLGKEYSNLYTQDLICHGVPSPLIWKKYVEYRQNKSGSDVRKIFFRDKKYGWKRYSVLFEFINNTEYRKDLDTDSFMKGFLSNLYLRPSCYACSFKTNERQADITLADFWGIHEVLPYMDDDKGCSFVWIHSEKGKEMFAEIKDKIKYSEIDPQKAIERNPSAIFSVPFFRRRKEFFSDLEKNDYENLIEKYTRISIWRRTRSFIGRVIHKIIR